VGVLFSTKSCQCRPLIGRACNSAALVVLVTAGAAALLA
jgi:hypothetical protein